MSTHAVSVDARKWLLPTPKRLEIATAMASPTAPELTVSMGPPTFSAPDSASAVTHWRT